MTKKWWEERFTNDAPVYMQNEAASAWANGWNAAVEAYREELLENQRKEGVAMIAGEGRDESTTDT